MQDREGNPFKLWQFRVLTTLRRRRLLLFIPSRIIVITTQTMVDRIAGLTSHCCWLYDCILGTQLGLLWWQRARLLPALPLGDVLCGV